jgi:hypothetical protein
MIGDLPFRHNLLRSGSNLCLTHFLPSFGYSSTLKICQYYSPCCIIHSWLFEQSLCRSSLHNWTKSPGVTLDVTYFGSGGLLDLVNRVTFHWVGFDTIRGRNTDPSRYCAQLLKWHFKFCKEIQNVSKNHAGYNFWTRNFIQYCYSWDYIWLFHWTGDDCMRGICAWGRRDVVPSQLLSPGIAVLFGSHKQMTDTAGGGGEWRQTI